jgi:riboflavin synthase alpha subunit
MAEIRKSLFVNPVDRIHSICDLNRTTIANSKEVKEWDMSINLEPDEIKANILKRPSIYINGTSG